MSSFITATVFFPVGRLDHFDTYISRYLADTALGVSLDGVVVTQAPVEADPHLAAIFWDNREMNRFRKASLPGGTLRPEPVYDPPLDDDGDAEGHTLTGHTIRCGWPQLFLDHVACPLAGDEALFAGVQMVA